MQRQTGSSLMGSLALAALAACSSGAKDGVGNDGGGGADGTSIRDGAKDRTAVDAHLQDGSGHATDGGHDAALDAPDTGVTVCATMDASTPGAPILFQVPSPVAPGQAALLFGGSVGASATVRGARLDDSPPGLPPGAAACVPTNASSLTVLQADELSVKPAIPSQWTQGLYALVVENAAGASAPVIVNRPRIDWIHGGPGGTLVAGSTFQIYGRSLGASPLAWIVDGTGTATALSTTADAGVGGDGYVATFAVPAGVAGSYQLYVHSGLGGPHGFSDPFVLEAVAPSPWPSTVFPVAANTGDDDGALAAALAQASGDGGAASGGIVSFASGSYTLTHGVTIPPRTVLRSATGNRSDVTLTFNEAVSPFPYGFVSQGNFVIDSLTLQSSTAARLLQCPGGGDFLRDPIEGEPQYQPDPPCENASVRNSAFTLTTLRDQDGTGAPTFTIMVVIVGYDTQISDSALSNSGGSAVTFARAQRLYLTRNTLLSGMSRVSADAAVPLAAALAALGGGNSEIYSMREGALVGNTAGAGPGLGSGGSAGVEYDAHDLYIADNTFGPNNTNYGEGFSFDAPYYPSFIGIPTSATGRTITIPIVLNAAGQSVFQGPATGVWPANDAGAIGQVSSDILPGNSVVVVNGTGLGQYAAVVANTATTSGGATALTIDRDWAIPLDGTSVLEVATMKSNVVFARNTFQDVAVGAQLYAGGYDFIIDGNLGASIEGTYCNGDDFMSERNGSSTNVQRRFSRCYFNQWINNTMTNHVDPDYAWVRPGHGAGVYTPYSNGLVGVDFGVGSGDFLPAARGIGVVGNILRSNAVADFTLGLVYGAGGGPISGTVPTLGEDNIVEQNQTSGVPVAVVVDSHFTGTLVRTNTCTGDCETVTENLNDGGS